MAMGRDANTEPIQDGQLSYLDNPSLFGGEVLDTSHQYASFLKGGKPGYLSKCPKYEGYWLLGGRGAVQCAGDLLPGKQWYEVCSKCPESCPLR